MAHSRCAGSMPRPMHDAVLRRRHRIVPAITIVAVLTFIAWTVVEQSSSPRIITIIAPGGSILVEVADTAAGRAIGLSHREKVHTGGLLLEWLTAGRHPIWMDRMRF